MKKQRNKNGDKTAKYLDPETRKFKAGNPGGGRPPGSISIIGRIKKIFEDDPKQFEQWVKDAIKDPKLRQELIRQIDGAPKQSVDVTSDGKPLAVTVVAYGSNAASPLHSEAVPITDTQGT